MESSEAMLIVAGIIGALLILSTNVPDEQAPVVTIVLDSPSPRRGWLSTIFIMIAVVIVIALATSR